MHAPRPYGLFVDGGELTERDKTFISHQMRKLTNTIQTEEVTSYRHEYELPDGGYVIVQDMGGIFKAIARKKEKFEKFKPDGFARLYVPMLFSGVITNARPRKPDQDKYGQGVGFKITEQCRNRLRNYNPKIKRPAKQLELQRFIIKPNQITVPEFVPKNDNSNFITTQYVQQRPTWYSGAMVELMQIVGGYGRQDLNELPNNDIERSRFLIPDKYIVDIADKLKGYRLPAYTGVPPIDGKYQYDYKFNSTNGVSFDSSGKPWLLRIRPTGIYAMPLPIVPATTTPEFKQYVEEIGDDELLKILERFGGMPSGEGMPVGNDFEAWRRAGVIIKVCDTSDFYSGIAYTSACGWSFNLNGSEGFNTCYTFDNDGIIVGNAYAAKLELAAAANHGWLKTEWVFKNQTETTIVNNYLQSLFGLMDVPRQRELAIRYKIGRQNTEQILNRALANPTMDRKEILYWDNLELEPIAAHKGSVKKVSSGFLYHHGNPKFHPQIKFPSVEASACISFDFSPQGLYLSSSYIIRCDTIMYGYYAGNTLKVVKYFLDTRWHYAEVDSNFEEMMTVGQWQEVRQSGQSSLWGNFYTTDLDFRDSFAPTITTTTIKGEDKGFDSKPRFAQDFIFFRAGTVFRYRYYTHQTSITKTEGRNLSITACIPYMMRDALILGEARGTSGTEKTEGIALRAMRDPTSYRYWTNDFLFAFIGGLEKMTGLPTPKNGDPVWVEIENYEPSEYSDFADQGSWLPDLPYDITWLIHPVRNEWLGGGGGGAPKIQEYSHTTKTDGEKYGSLYFSVSENPYKINSKPPDNAYFLSSPSQYGDLFYRDGCRVGFGDSEYVNISESGNNNLRKSWGYSALVDHKSAHHFIGVINE